MTATKHNFTGAEIKAGILVLASIAVFVVFAITIQQSWSRTEGDEYDVWFRDTKGLNRGADVRYGGALVGRVKEIAIALVPRVEAEQLDLVDTDSLTAPIPERDPDAAAEQTVAEPEQDLVPRVIVTISLVGDPHIPINAASRAFITNTTLTSDKHLEITTATSDETVRSIDDRLIIPVQEGDMFGQVNALLADVREGLGGIGELLGVDSRAQNGEDAELTTVADLFETLNGAMQEGTSLVGDARTMLGDNRADIDRIFDSLYDIEQGAHDLMVQLNEAVAENRPLITGTLERIPPMLDQFAAISEQLSAITGKLDGILVDAESMSANAAGMLDQTGPEVADLVTDIRLTVRNLNDLILMLGEEPESILFGRSRGRRSGDDR